MPRKEWWYLDGDERKGPVSESKLQQIHSSGHIDDDTLVWTIPMDDWQPYRVMEFAATKPPPTGRTAIDPDEIVGHSGRRNKDVEGIHPWRRLGARWTDVFLFTSTLAVLGALIPGIIILLIWIPLEALMLSSWGYTPGKWLLGVRVTDSEGRALTFEQGLNRAFMVWLKGLGLGIPFIAPITLIVAYIVYTREGISTWDRDLKTTVHFEKLPFYKLVGIAAFLTLNLWVVAVVAYALVVLITGAATTV